MLLYNIITCVMSNTFEIKLICVHINKIMIFEELLFQCLPIHLIFLLGYVPPTSSNENHNNKSYG